MRLRRLKLHLVLGWPAGDIAGLALLFVEREEVRQSEQAAGLEARVVVAGVDTYLKYAEAIGLTAGAPEAASIGASPNPEAAYL